MSANISTDQELDRLLSMREASSIPLPPEIALSEPGDSRRFFAWLLPYRLLGFEDHPVVQMLRSTETERMMAASVSRAHYLDRISHYGSYLNGSKLRIVDLVGPTRDDQSAPAASDPDRTCTAHNPTRRRPTDADADVEDPEGGA